MYDTIIVGGRCAGASTAMLLARQGFKVLLLDKTTFPSDTISTHIVWPHGAEILARWGLLPALAATGAPPICRRMTFDVGPFALRGTIPDANDGAGGFCPRRIILDNLLVGAAAQSGVEVRESFTVDELLVAGDTIVGIRGRGKNAKPVEERARIVIGADGVNSVVARAVRAPENRRSSGCGLLLLLVFQRRRAGRHRAIRPRPLRVWRRSHSRRPSSRHGELAGQAVSSGPRRYRRARPAGARDVARFSRSRA